VAEERHQVHPRPPVLAFDVNLAALVLGDEVVLAQKLFRRFAEGFLGFDLAAAELQVPVFGDLLGFRRALFLRARAAVFPAEVAGTLSAAAVRTFVNVNLAAQDRVVFRHRGCLRSPSKRKM